VWEKVVASTRNAITREDHATDGGKTYTVKVAAANLSGLGQRRRRVERDSSPTASALGADRRDRDRRGGE